MAKKYIIATSDKEYKYSHFSSYGSCFTKYNALSCDDLSGMRKLLSQIHEDFKSGNTEYVSVDEDDIIPNDANVSNDIFVLDGDENFEKTRLLKLNYNPSDLKIYEQILTIQYKEVK